MKLRPEDPLLVYPGRVGAQYPGITFPCPVQNPSPLAIFCQSVHLVSRSPHIFPRAESVRRVVCNRSLVARMSWTTIYQLALMAS